jgi:hypothetical protein
MVRRTWLRSELATELRTVPFDRSSITVATFLMAATTIWYPGSRIGELAHGGVVGVDGGVVAKSENPRIQLRHNLES